MPWTDHAIWWHLYPLGFVGAPIRDADTHPSARLERLLPWLDHAIRLGTSGLLLGPIFHSQTHGYDTIDHYRIDPRLGDEATFTTLVNACHDRGLRIVLDGVFSHVGNEHPALTRTLRGEESGLFEIDRSLTGEPRLVTFEGHQSLIRLNHSSEQTADFVTDVMNYWLDRGIDGWRLDAAYSIPTSFWSRVLPRVRARHPNSWFLGEVIHGDYTSFVSSSGIDTLTQYELWKAIWSSIKDRNFFELDWALTRHAEFLASFVPNTFIGNHDVTRIASTVGSEAAITAVAILMTVGGIPSIYAGDEFGFAGIKEERLGGDDDIRPEFPARANDVRGDERILRAYQDLIGIRRRHPWLTRARTRSLHLTNTKYCYRAATPEGDQWIDVAVSLEDRPHAIITDRSGTTLWDQKQAR